MPAPKSDIPTELIVAALSQDEVLKQYIRHIGWKVLREAEYLIEHGSPTTKLAVMKNLMPAVVKALTAQSEDDKYNRMRQDFESLIRDLLGDQTVLPIDGPDDEDD